MSLLGAILANNKAFEGVADFLEPKHFVDPVNGRIFDAAREIILEGGLADAVTLRARFQNSGELDEVGGSAYLAKLLTSLVSLRHAADYGRAVLNAWLRRSIIEIAGEVVERAYADGSFAPDKLIDECNQRLGDLGAGGASHRLLTIGEAVREAIEHCERVYQGEIAASILTGIRAIDEGLGGFYPKNLTILAGIPGAGKTTLAVQAAYGIAQSVRREGVARGLSDAQALKLPGVAIFSLEMSGQELGERVAAWRAGIPIERILKGDIDVAMLDALLRAQHEAEVLPLRIYDCNGMSLTLLGAKIRMHLRRQRELAVFVDHVLALDDPDSREMGKSAHAVTRTVQVLRRIARDDDVSMIALSHVSRRMGERPNPRPMLADLKYGGEGDADAVAFVHRPIQFMPSAPPPKSPRDNEQKHAARVADYYTERAAAKDLAELVVEKRRKGALGVQRMRFIGERTTFEDWQE